MGQLAVTSTRTLVGEHSPADGTRAILPIDLVLGAMGESGARNGRGGGGVIMRLCPLGWCSIEIILIV